MILAGGKLYGLDRQEEILSKMETEINNTRRTKTLSTETVVAALDRLGTMITEGIFDETIDQLGIDGVQQYKEKMILALKRETILYQMTQELGENPFADQKTRPPFGQKGITVRTMPLGTLLHIAAGNVDGLPAYSVAEGLLTGNVNLLKLPQADKGLSVKIINALIQIEPLLSDFIYVFDTPSSDLATLKKLAGMADGIVVWGGDAAVAAVRQFAPAGTRLIEWGHKLSFAYISGYENKEQELTELAEHILSTKQLLCSSCQTIFLDTERMEEVYTFCQAFLPYLEAAARQFPANDIGAAAEITLQRYHRRLEEVLAGSSRSEKRVFQGKGCSLTACPDHSLELSQLFGNCLVKRLPCSRMFDCLREYKGYLQTAGLICSPEKRAGLSDCLARSGVVRITRAGSMSSAFCGEAHDGDYALRRYLRIVNIE